MSDETTDPIAAIVREAMDYAADHGRITTPEDYADRIRETLATPAAGEDVRQRVGAVLRRWNRLAGDVEGSDGPLTETEIAAISRDVAAALRSESPEAPSGEGETRVRVPEAMDRGCDCSGCYCGNSGDAESVGYADGWNACRAEMLAALRSAPTGEAEVDEGVHDLADRLQAAAEKLDANGGFWIESGDDFAEQVVMDMQEAARALRAAALRSEAPGEDELRRENERLTKAWYAAHEARRRAEDEARLWFDRYQALRSEAPGEDACESCGQVVGEDEEYLYCGDGVIVHQECADRDAAAVREGAAELVRAARRGEGGGE